MAKLRVLMTGATGRIARQLLPAFRERYDLTLVDAKTKDNLGNEVEGVQVLDVLRDDEDKVRQVFEDIDVAVPLAVNRPDGDDIESQYQGERANVDMMQRIYRLSFENGVNRVVGASTNQAARWYERPYHEGLIDRVSPDDYPKPDNFYGWAKAAYEVLGFLYACGSLGRQLEVVQLRIVAPRPIKLSDFIGKHRREYFRDIAGYFSERDMQQLFIKSIESEDINDEFGVPFQIFNGRSNNTRQYWSITNARRVIDYSPQDDSEIEFASDIAKVMQSDEEFITEELVRGSA